jgi:hypothetical protein
MNRNPVKFRKNWGQCLTSPRFALSERTQSCQIIRTFIQRLRNELEFGAYQAMSISPITNGRFVDAQKFTIFSIHHLLVRQNSVIQSGMSMKSFVCSPTQCNHLCETMIRRLASDFSFSHCGIQDVLPAVFLSIMSLTVKSLRHQVGVRTHSSISRPFWKCSNALTHSMQRIRLSTQKVARNRWSNSLHSAPHALS